MGKCCSKPSTSISIPERTSSETTPNEQGILENPAQVGINNQNTQNLKTNTNPQTLQKVQKQTPNITTLHNTDTHTQEFEKRKTKLKNDQSQDINEQIVTEQETCCICLEKLPSPQSLLSFDQNELNQITPHHFDCKHCFHKACIEEWLGRSNRCPLCRQLLSPLEGLSIATQETDSNFSFNVSYDNWIVDAMQILEDIRPRMQVRMQELQIIVQELQEPPQPKQPPQTSEITDDPIMELIQTENISSIEQAQTLIEKLFEYIRISIQNINGEEKTDDQSDKFFDKIDSLIERLDTREGLHAKESSAPLNAEKKEMESNSIESESVIPKSTRHAIVHLAAMFYFSQKNTLVGADAERALEHINMAACHLGMPLTSLQLDSGMEFTIPHTSCSIEFGSMSSWQRDKSTWFDQIVNCFFWPLAALYLELAGEIDLIISISESKSTKSPYFEYAAAILAHHQPSLALSRIQRSYKCSQDTQCLWKEERALQMGRNVLIFWITKLRSLLMDTKDTTPSESSYVKISENTLEQLNVSTNCFEVLCTSTIEKCIQQNRQDVVWRLYIYLLDVKQHILGSASFDFTLQLVKIAEIFDHLKLSDYATRLYQDAFDNLVEFLYQSVSQKQTDLWGDDHCFAMEKINSRANILQSVDSPNFAQNTSCAFRSATNLLQIVSRLLIYYSEKNMYSQICSIVPIVIPLIVDAVVPDRKVDSAISLKKRIPLDNTLGLPIHIWFESLSSIAYYLMQSCLSNALDQTQHKVTEDSGENVLQVNI